MIPIAKPFLEKRAAVKEVIFWMATQGPRSSSRRSVLLYEARRLPALLKLYGVSSRTSCRRRKAGDVVITVSLFHRNSEFSSILFGRTAFIDIDPHTYNMSQESLNKCLYEDQKCGTEFILP
jgi:hypothetical protein